LKQLSITLTWRRQAAVSNEMKSPAFAEDLSGQIAICASDFAKSHRRQFPAPFHCLWCAEWTLGWKISLSSKRGGRPTARNRGWLKANLSWWAGWRNTIAQRS
jgi:hypothetical protein